VRIYDDEALIGVERCPDRERADAVVERAAGLGFATRVTAPARGLVASGDRDGT
jgi:hypothetical protein